MDGLRLVDREGVLEGVRVAPRRRAVAACPRRRRARDGSASFACGSRRASKPLGVSPLPTIIESQVCVRHGRRSHAFVPARALGSASPATVGGRAGRSRSRPARPRLVGGRDPRGEGSCRPGVGERDDQAAEATAREAWGDGALAQGEVDQQIEELGVEHSKSSRRLACPSRKRGCRGPLGPGRQAPRAHERTRGRGRSRSATTWRRRRRATSSTPAASAAFSASSTVISDGRIPLSAGRARSRASALRVA